MPTYRILAIYGADLIETIESEIESLREANYLRAEYAIAYGDDWTILVEVEYEDEDEENEEEE